MELEETYVVERAKWDDFASEALEAPSLATPDGNFETYASRSSIMVGVGEFLGDLEGMQVLEYGCGLGAVSVLLARSGAEVTAFDLSEVSINVARKRAIENNVEDKIDFVVAGGEDLPFANESFDIVFGKAILHHLDVNLGWYDLRRVLKNRGKAAFVEPMGMNPVLNFVREYVPYPGKHPRGADRPLNYAEINQWGKGFSKSWHRELQLLSMIERGFGFRKRLHTLRRLDRLLLTRVPYLRRFCRYVVMYLVK